MAEDEEDEEDEGALFQVLNSLKNVRKWPGESEGDDRDGEGYA